MAVYDYSNIERAEAYRVLADFFLKAPARRNAEHHQGGFRA